MIVSTNEPEQGAAPDPGPLVPGAHWCWLPGHQRCQTGGLGAAPLSPASREEARLTFIYPGDAISSSAAPGAGSETILARGFWQPEAP